MADTLQNILLPAAVWVNLYTETGIDVGLEIIVQNIGVCDVSLSASFLQPTDENSRHILERGQYAVNQAYDSGAWAFCRFTGGLLNVRLV